MPAVYAHKHGLMALVGDIPGWSSGVQWVNEGNLSMGQVAGDILAQVWRMMNLERPSVLKQSSPS